ncbi:hypothetical protein CDAR_247581 [Caerostris darwini]|uniref:Uncharacterized protein n=1 Tax=Caerostris darwini TaxID=1538125 RepID=A0AAV4N6Y6_9ARAC|nr:hypothetical protein CDAR_247581 [Caerostris darwini]
MVSSTKIPISQQNHLFCCPQESLRNRYSPETEVSNRFRKKIRICGKIDFFYVSNLSLKREERGEVLFLECFSEKCPLHIRHLGTWGTWAPRRHSNEVGWGCFSQSAALFL